MVTLVIWALARKKYIWAGLGVILASILLLNTYAYFWIYPQTLPNKNTPFAKNIADYINQSVSPDLPVLMYGCCWGDWGQPEPQAIKFQIATSHDFFQIEKTVPLTAIPIQMWSQRILVVTAPDSVLPRALTENSLRDPVIIVKNGYNIAKVYTTILPKSL